MEPPAAPTPPPQPQTAPRRYVPPSWSREPRWPCGLDVIKGGALLETLPLKGKAWFMIGRAEDADIAALHESVSRYHAVLQFGENGAAYITDLGSNYGTRVNKELIKPKVYHSLQAGSVIKFGESTRLYVFVAPPELEAPEQESPELLKLRLESEQRQARKKAERERLQAKLKPKARPDADGIMWGFGEDAQDDEEDEQEGFVDEEGNPIVDVEKVHENDRKLFEKLQAKRTKLANVRKEIERIRSKDNAQGGLSDGQERQIQRNNQVIEDLERQIAEHEQTLAERRNARDPARKAGAVEDMDGVELDSGGMDDDDDFFDRTGLAHKRAKAAAAASGSSESQAAAEATNYKKLLLQLQEVESRYVAIHQQKLDVQPAAEVDTSTMDPLDAYVAIQDAEQAAKLLKTLERRLQDTLNERNSIRRLLDVAKPAGVALSDIFLPIEHVVAKAAAAASAPTTTLAEPVAGVQLSSTETEAAPASAPAPAPAPPDVSGTRPSGATAVQPSPETPPPAAAAATEAKRIYGPMRPPAAPDTSRPEKRGREDPAEGPASKRQAEHVEWLPPVHQSGDGRTSLNDKFGY